MHFLVRSAFVAAAVWCAAPASAAYVVDTGSGGSYSGSIIDAQQSVAGRFTLAADTVVTSAEGYIAGNGGGTGVIAIYDGGPTPGALLYSARFSPVATPAPGAWQGVFGRSWLLTAGTYWIGFSTNTFNYLTWSALNPLDLEAYNNGNGWNTFSAPISVRLGDDPPAIPEPASWALMITGFAAVGLGLRRRRVGIA